MEELQFYVAADIREAMRKRPGMYLPALNGMGICALIGELLQELLEAVPEQRSEVLIRRGPKRWRIALRVDKPAGLTQMVTRPTISDHAGLLCAIHLSESCRVDLTRGPRKQSLLFQKGLRTKKRSPQTLGKKPGTLLPDPVLEISFLPDPEIFSSIHFPMAQLHERLDSLARFHPQSSLYLVSSQKLGDDHLMQRFRYPSGFHGAFDEMASVEIHHFTPPFFAEGSYGAEHYVLGFFLGRTHRHQVFAGGKRLEQAGSMVRGFLEGLIEALLRLRGEPVERIRHCNPNRLWRQLQLLMAVSGQHQMAQDGARLESGVIRQNVRGWTSRHMQTWLEGQPEVREEIEGYLDWETREDAWATFLYWRDLDTWEERYARESASDEPR